MINRNGRGGGRGGKGEARMESGFNNEALERKKENRRLDLRAAPYWPLWGKGAGREVRGWEMCYPG